MISTRSSTVKGGCCSGFTRMATVTASKAVRLRAMMSRWPLVMGSKDPGITARDRRLSLTRALLPLVESQTVVADAHGAGPGEAPYCRRELPFVEVLGHRHAARLQQAHRRHHLENFLV